MTTNSAVAEYRQLFSGDALALEGRATNKELGGADEPDLTSKGEEQAEKDFHKFRQQMNSVSAKTPPFELAAELIFPNWRTTGRCIWTSGGNSARELEFYPWQVTAAAWFHMMRATGTGFAILGDDMGLGKTMSCLLYVLLSARTPAPQSSPSPSSAVVSSEISALDKLKRGPYRPTLVLMPNTAIKSWVDDIGRIPDLKVLYFCNARQRERGVKTLDELRSSLSALDPSDEQTARTIVLSTYATFRERAGTRQL